ncbi:aquaporin family protein [Formicincola oecophyllae]|uniref:Aquaporin family protein n=1 Tax=Formicincola oecophyllae TaxID=2558361 RepID=A0A4Y6U9K5_9PROT|nr:MIP/aquaporin family protein [Formicincola oecophyllae]QDH13710.1 aquaporin family protein [Formicincola oecophyllae]
MTDAPHQQPSTPRRAPQARLAKMQRHVWRWVRRHGGHTIQGALHGKKPHIKFPHIRFYLHELKDRPLSGAPTQRWHWRLYGCEALATAIMMVVGLSVCMVTLASSSPLAQWLRHWPLVQIALCGLGFGLACTAGALTRFGKVSGAHLNPSVSLAFFLSGRMKAPDMLGYFGAQLLGSLMGTAALWLVGCLVPQWAQMAQQTGYGGTYPAHEWPLWAVMVAELIATMGLVLVMLWFVAHPRFQRFAAWWTGPYFCIMNPLVAFISGDSTNFTRTLAPALFMHDYRGLWIYLVGPFLGSALAIFLVRSAVLGKLSLREARLVNFGHYGRVPQFAEPEAAGPSPEWLKANPPPKTSGPDPVAVDESPAGPVAN